MLRHILISCALLQAASAQLVTYIRVVGTNADGVVTQPTTLWSVNADAIWGSLLAATGTSPSNDIKAFLNASGNSAARSSLFNGTSLVTWGSLAAPSADVQSFLGSANNAAARTSLFTGTSLGTWGGLAAPSANVQTLLGSANNAAFISNLELSSLYQGLDTELTALAGLPATASNASKLLRVNTAGTGYEYVSSTAAPVSATTTTEGLVMLSNAITNGDARVPTSDLVYDAIQAVATGEVPYATTVDPGIVRLAASLSDLDTGVVTADQVASALSGGTVPFGRITTFATGGTFQIRDGLNSKATTTSLGGLPLPLNLTLLHAYQYASNPAIMVTMSQDMSRDENILAASPTYQSVNFLTDVNFAKFVGGSGGTVYADHVHVNNNYSTSSVIINSWWNNQYGDFTGGDDLVFWEIEVEIFDHVAGTLEAAILNSWGEFVAVANLDATANTNGVFRFKSPYAMQVEGIIFTKAYGTSVNYKIRNVKLTKYTSVATWNPTEILYLGMPYDTTQPRMQLGGKEVPIFSNFNAASANTIVALDSDKHLVGLNTTTYPSLTELASLKGVSGTIWNSNNDGPASTLDADTVDGVQGSQIFYRRTYAYVTTTTTATINYTYGCSGTFNVALPAVTAENAGFTIAVQNIGSGVITVVPSGGNFIGASVTAFPLGPFSSAIFESNGGSLWLTF